MAQLKNPASELLKVERSGLVDGENNVTVRSEVDIMGINIFEVDCRYIPYQGISRIENVDVTRCSRIDVRACPPYEIVSVITSLHGETEGVLPELRPLLNDRQCRGIK